MKEMKPNAFIGSTEDGTVLSENHLSVDADRYNQLVRELNSLKEEKERKIENIKKSRVQKDETPYVKVYRKALELDLFLNRLELITWSCVRLSLRSDSEFFYFRPTVLVKLAKHYYKRVMDISEASKGIRGLKEKGYIVSVGRDLYMVNHHLAFNGNRHDVLKQHKDFDLFGFDVNNRPYTNEVGITSVDAYLKSIDFNYEAELKQGVVFIETKTRLKNLASSTANTDIQLYEEAVIELAKANRRINEEKRRKLKEKDELLSSN